MVHEIRFALRGLRRSPVFALSAIAALALGIGANAAVFSVVHAVLLKPLPYSEPDRLVKLSESNAVEGRDDGRVSRGTFVDWRARTRTLESLAAYSRGGEALWTIGDRLQTVHVSAATPSLARVLAVQPILGHWFPDEGVSQAPAPLVISYGLWQRAFGGAPDVIGRRVLIEGRTSREIGGVMPPGFSYPDGTDAWTSLSPGGTIAPQQRRFLYYHVVGRIRPGSTLTGVRAEFDTLAAQLAAEVPDANAGWTARVVPLAGADAVTSQAPLLALSAAVAGVLLIGCANVANLLLARAASRRREMGVRLALGAGLRHLVRQSFAEAAVLSLCATTAGAVLATWISGALVSVAPPDIPRLADVATERAGWWFAAAAGVLTAVFLGLIPALQAAAAVRGATIRPDLRAATPSAARMRRLLIGGEVAIVVLMLTGALLLLRTFVSLRGVDLGFEAERVWSVSTRWPLGRLVPSAPGPPSTPRARPWPRVQRAVDGLIDAVAATPGVESVGLISEIPLSAAPYSGTVWRSDAPGAAGLTPPQDPRDRWRADLSIVTAGYFSALGVPFLRGRNFVDGDRWTDAQLNASTVPDGGVAIVNQAFVARYFGGEDPIGRTLVLYDDQTFGWNRTIVGVVADVRGRAVAEAAEPAVFVPHAQHPDVFLPSLIVRTSLPPASVVQTLRDRIAAYDPQLLVQRVRPMEEVVSGALSRPRFNLLLVGSFALIGLALAAVGIYGVVSFLVAQRTREIGIRMALGARAGDVRRLVVADGMLPVLAGAVCGIVAAMPASRAIRSLLFGVAPVDAISFAAAPALLVAVALSACYFPARRATRVDPLIALRED
jgi:putative ABC transport system permease protein